MRNVNYAMRMPKSSFSFSPLLFMKFVVCFPPIFRYFHTRSVNALQPKIVSFMNKHSPLLPYKPNLIEHYFVDRILAFTTSNLVLNGQHSATCIRMWFDKNNVTSVLRYGTRLLIRPMSITFVAYLPAPIEQHMQTLFSPRLVLCYFWYEPSVHITTIVIVIILLQAKWNG